LSIKLSKFRELDDSVLIEQAQDGDRRAFSELVRRHQNVVYRSCYRILGDREDAKDASQEAFIRAYRKLDTFRGRSTFRTWMLRVATNVSLNEYGRRGLPRAEGAAAEDIPAPNAPETELMKSEAAARIHEALRLVQPNHRAAIVLHDLEGLSYQETAEILGSTEGTARSWAYRGRKRLKELLT
jgi:RNA polymerase sigma-70 factor (ECF subfamily)